MKKLLALVPLLTLAMLFARADYQLPIKNASASSYERLNEIFNSYDGDTNTLYHSLWSGGGFPITLTYNLFGPSQVDYLIYTPRLDGISKGKFDQTEIWYASVADPSHFIKIMDHDFAGPDHATRVNLPAGLHDVVSIRLVVKSGENNFASCAEMQFFATGNAPTSSVHYIAGDLSPVKGSGIQVPVMQATDNNHEPGTDVSLSYDNDLASFYHSSWAGGGFPIDLTYTLTATDSINRIVYYPRQDQSVNGLFEKISISYNTMADPAEFQHAGDFDLKGSSQPATIDLPQTLIKPYQVRVTVLSGVNSFASCAEMQFFRTGSFLAPKVFSDNSFSTLRSWVTQADIDTMSNPFYKNIAQHLFDNTYQTAWRVQTYAPYPTVETTAAALNINTWSPFENPTGVVFKKDESVAIFVKAPLPPHVSLTICNMQSGNFEIQHYLLQEGANVIKPALSGLGYISYYDDDYLSLPPVTINIAGGTVNGYFDVAKHTNADWSELLNDTAYRMMDIVGKEISFCFDKNILRYYTPGDGLSLIGMYDSIIHEEHVMEGLIKYGLLPKNRQFAATTATGGWRTGGFPGSMFELSWAPDGLATVDGIRRIGMWGIAHEFGHANQISPDLDWVGMGEVTNNMYTIWCAWTFGRDALKKPFETDPYDYAGSGGAAIGGKMNSFLNEGVVKGKPYLLQNEGDPFTKLVPLWQIMLYYQLAGQGNSWSKPDWQKDVSQVSRNTHSAGLSQGQLELNFMRNVCDAVREDLTDFFKKAGMLKPIDSLIDQWAVVKITQSDIDGLTAYASRYPKPASPVLYYLSANSVDAYRYQRPVTGVTGAGVNFKKGDSDSLVIDHRQWANVAAFEVYRHDTLVSASITGTNSTDTNFTVVVLPDSLSPVFAVGWDGVRKKVYPDDIPLALDNITLRAGAKGSAAELSWNLGHEDKTLTYEIQHSTDVVSFVPIGKMAATGSGDYTYRDDHALTDGQPNYYRIRAVDRDGSVKYSNIAIVSINNFLLSTYPVPFEDMLTVRLAALSEIKQVRMTGVSGLSLAPAWKQEGSTVNVYTANLSAGIYLLELTDAQGQLMVVKVLKH